MIELIEKEINDNIDTSNISFFKTILQNIPGGYGEIDILIGVKSPVLRKFAKKYYKEISNEELLYFLTNSIHEYRLFAVMIMILKSKKYPDDMFKMFTNNLNFINNWDIIDISTPTIIGKYLYDFYDEIERNNFINCLYDSDNFWYRRIAILSTMYFIKKGDIDFCLEFYEKVVNDKCDLNNKALGWALREVGKCDKNKMINFINTNKLKRITFNYAGEKLTKEEKSKLIKYFVLFLILLFPFNIEATTGKIKEENTKVIDNIRYGYHGSDNHCHIVNEKNGVYYAGESVDISYCQSIKSDNTEKIIIILKKCVDGDTAKFTINDEEKTLRFLAIDTEESVSSTKLNTFMGKIASNYTCNKLKKANKIELEYDSNSEKTDKYNRLLGWIFVDNELLQQDLIENGYAKVAYLYGTYKYTDDLKKYEELAKEKEIGIWDENNIIANVYNFIQKVLKIFT